MDLSENLFSGSIPSSFNNLRDLETLNLARNQFSGDLEFWQLDSSSTLLSYVDLSHNQFSGSLLKALWFVTKAFNFTFKAAFNQFSGNLIPETSSNSQSPFGYFEFGFLNVSNNLLSGSI